MLSPREIIGRKGSNAVQAFRHNRALEVRWAGSLTNLMEQIGHEYGGRFVVELIQNGHDAHASTTRNGVIHIFFEANVGEHGEVFVANSGQPFTEANFHALCDIAQSDKVPGAGIGHKGVGFRSVLQVSRAPEIYSAMPAGSSGVFDGFCFRFANGADYCRLADGDHEFYEIMRRELSPYLLPVPADSFNPVIASFAQDGFATAIRLPLVNEYAGTVAEERIDELRNCTNPALLFLERISLLTVEYQGTQSRYRTDLKRKSQTLAQNRRPDDVVLERVELTRTDEQASEVSLGTYLVVKIQVDPALLRAAIQESIASGQIEARFATWQEEAFVSLAVRLDAEDATSKLYAYLPMEADAPLPGHLNAPFVTKVARTALDETIPLNSLLFTTAAKAAVRAIQRLRDEDVELSEGEIHSAVADLLSWKTSHLEFLKDAFHLFGLEVSSEPVIPVLTRRAGPEWACLSDARDWASNYSIMTPNALAACGVAILRPTLSVRQKRSLRELAEALGTSLTPTAARVASWAELIAVQMAAQPFDPVKWAQLYSDLHRYFSRMSWNPAYAPALQGKKILIDDHCEVRRTGPFKGSRDAAVFFPPAEENALAQVVIPQTISSQVCFLNRGLTLPSEVREWLQNPQLQLALRYDTRGLIAYVADVGQSSDEDTIRADVLRLVFDLYYGAGAKPPMLEGVRLRVPARSGWVLAEEAVFSGDWTGTQGTVLQPFIREVGPASAEVAKMERQLLRSPRSKPFVRQRTAEWVDLLRLLGVRDGLWPIRLRAPEATWAYVFTRQKVGKTIGLSESDIELWSKIEGHQTRRPQMQYEFSGDFFKLPGQSDYSSFSADGRSQYALLIVEGLRAWKDEHLAVRADTLNYRRSDPHDWPTPAAAFLQEGEWLQDGTGFVRPREAWYFPRKDGEPAPSFFPFVRRSLADLIGPSDIQLARLRKFGMKVFGDPNDAAALIVRLPVLLLSGKVSEEHWRAFSRIYHSAWSAVVERKADPFSTSPDELAVITRGLQLATVPMRQEKPDETIYLNDLTDPLALTILQELRRPVLDVGSPTVGAGALPILQEHFGGHLCPTSSLQIRILADGQPVELSEDLERLLSQERRWLEEVVGLTIYLKSLVPRHRSEQAEREAQRLLGSIRIKWAREIGITINGEPARLPRHQNRAVGIAGPSAPVLVIAAEAHTFEWNILEAIATPLARLINRASVNSALELVFVRLKGLMGDHVVAPSDDELACALECDIAEVRRYRREVRSSIDAVLERLRPLLLYYAGRDALVALDRSVPGKSALISILARWSVQLPRTAEALVQECEVSDLAELREALGIPYASFNSILSDLGSPYRPFHNVVGDNEAFEAFRQRNRSAILNRLRSRFRNAFTNNRSLSAYVAIRNLDGLKPDVAWLETCHLPSEKMMGIEVARWIDAIAAEAAVQGSDALPDLAKTRATNRRSVEELIRECAPVVSAWCRRNKQTLPGLWNSADPAAIVVDSMDQAGQYDFDVLATTRILGWLRASGHWPDSMPMTNDKQQLGLTPEDLNVKSEAEVERERREYERRSIVYNGKRFTAVECAALIANVETSIPQAFFATGKGFSSLVEVGKAHGVRGGGGPGGYARHALNEDQRGLVGLVGEKVALEWLKRKYPGTDENSWKSTNRDRSLGGRPGSDSLGYDFEVFERGRRLFFEVKATIGEQPILELGETELRTANENARRDNYRILFITQALEPSQRRIFVLPNPFSSRAQGFYQLTGTGIRYRFRLEG
jgi:Domain of unknown function (DUF3883)